MKEDTKEQKENKQDIQEHSQEDYQAKIDSLKKEIDGLRGQSEIATLEAQIMDLRKQKINSQISEQQAQTGIPGYEEEFQRLKEDAIKGVRKYKRDQILSFFSALFGIPFSALIVYVIFTYTGLSSIVDQEFTQIMYIVVAVILGIAVISNISNLIKTILINPEKLSDQTLSYLSLTAKEHLLDPKGSVIREKYGTAKWTSVTHT